MNVKGGGVKETPEHLIDVKRDRNYFPTDLTTFTKANLSEQNYKKQDIEFIHRGTQPHLNISFHVSQQQQQPNKLRFQFCTLSAIKTDFGS